MSGECICENCYFYSAVQPEHRDLGGWCRRYPPVANGARPLVAAEQWCGEWKKRRKVKP